MHRTLPRGAPRPGRWDPEFCPYIDPIADAALDTRLRMLVIMMGTQMGKTEFMLNLLGMTCAERPRPALYYGPGETWTRSLAKDRWETMLEQTPELGDHIDPRAERNSSIEKWINGVRVGFGWPAPSQLRGHPAALVLADEVDDPNWTPAPGHGDPISKLEGRTSNYNGLVVLTSTPGEEGRSRIWRWLLRGTLERWALECRDCRAWWAPMLDHLTWAKDAVGDALRRSARLTCPGCGASYTDRQRRELAGRYIPHRYDKREFVPLDAVPELTIRSFWVSGLASPFRTLGEAADQVATAFRSGDSDEVQTVTTEVGGEAYRVQGDAPALAAVRTKCQSYTWPEQVQRVVMACDVQERSIYHVARGFGWMAESWLLRWGQLHGDTDYDDVWLALEQIAKQCGPFRVDLLLIDAGYRPDRVFSFLRRTGLGDATRGGPPTQKRPVFDTLINEHESGQTDRGGVRQWTWNTDYYKRQHYARIRHPADQPGDWHVPTGVEDEYCEQITNERRSLYRGRVEWVTTGNRRNHLLDCEAQCWVGAEILNVGALPSPQALADARERAAHEQARPSRPSRPRQGL